MVYALRIVFQNAPCTFIANKSNFLTIKTEELNGDIMVLVFCFLFGNLLEIFQCRLTNLIFTFSILLIVRTVFCVSYLLTISKTYVVKASSCIAWY